MVPRKAWRCPTFSLYLRLFQYGFRRHATYRAATLAGAFTNTVFGILRAYVLIALWQARPGLAGYDVADAVTFCFLTQGLLEPMRVFGGGLELSERVRTGAIAIDLVRPAPLQLWMLAQDLGRAAYHVVVRGVPPMLAGAALFGVVLPDGPLTWAAFAASVAVGVVVSFGLRYLVALSSCWVLDDRGVQTVSLVATLFFSGMVVPLVIFPGWLGDLARALPWAAIMQVPADVYLGKTEVTAALGFQALWAAALLALGALATRAARHKVIIQGG